MGRTLALQNFRISHLINAEILANFCTTRGRKNKVEKKSILMWVSTYYKMLYNGFQINDNAFCFGEKNGFKSFFSPILLSECNMGIGYINNILDHENPL